VEVAFVVVALAARRFVAVRLVMMAERAWKSEAKKLVDEAFVRVALPT
jgi:hypothetical protein